MSALGGVRIGHRAPDFHCEAVVNGVIQDVSLDTYIPLSAKGSSPDPKAPWLILLFIPAAFSFVCPTEVLAFQNCLDEFKDRNCSVVFVSVDTKHSLWHWQNVPRQYGGLGHIDVPLLSDPNHRMCRDYGVLIEEEGISLRGMFIVDGAGIVQQVTLNNVTVGRSVLEALRLLEAFQAVARHGVLCPIDWKPSSNAADTLSTISNTLTASYGDRLANLQKEFGDVPVIDLDAKHKLEDGEYDNISESRTKSDTSVAQVSTTSASPRTLRSDSSPQPVIIEQVSCERRRHPSPSVSLTTDCLPRMGSSPLLKSPKATYTGRSVSVPTSTNITPTPTPATSPTRHPSLKPTTQASTARHARGRKPSLHLNVDQRYVNSLFSDVSNAPSIFQSLVRHLSSPTDSASGHSTAPPVPIAKNLPPHLAKHNTYESRRGSHVVLEFADPTLSQNPSPLSTPSLSAMGVCLPHRSRSQHTTRNNSPSGDRSTGWNGPNGYDRKASDPPRETHGMVSNLGVNGQAATSQTRLQATFEAIKKMSTGLATPRVELSPKKNEAAEGARSPPGYFDVITDEGT
ncbi:thioredoxin-like protein [Pyrenochaeta sp. MPI-SDFR-AT-0127]|nr:thioredoxin-like protein [Pyrenochaeta sp. MPI-SDFR-AT-0127]